MDHLHKAGALADLLISREVAVQEQMWSPSDDASRVKGEMIRAAVAQATIVGYHDAVKHSDEPVMEEQELMAGIADDIYPEDWSGFRSYGSDVANLVVAAAYLRSEIKRRIAAGEDTTRTKRGEPYINAKPVMSSEEAIRNLEGRYYDGQPNLPRR